MPRPIEVRVSALQRLHEADVMELMYKELESRGFTGELRGDLRSFEDISTMEFVVRYYPLRRDYLFKRHYWSLIPEWAARKRLLFRSFS